MALEQVPTDVAADDLVLVYRQAAQRLEGIVRAYLRRGIDPSRVGRIDQVRGDATAAYRTRQLQQALAILQELETTSRIGTATATRRAYEAALLAVDRVGITDSAGARPAFGTIHRRSVDALASNLDRSLLAATQRARANVQQVFARAAVLEGPLEAVGLEGIPFLGRRLDDPWRRLALQTIAGGTISLDTREQITRELKRRLIREGVTDALTGFVDRAGRRWPLPVYAEMVVRTTTREATSRATVSRLLEHEVDLVTVSSHPHHPDVCDDYDGRTFSLGGGDSRYPALNALPPFHPRCRHVIAPASVSLDDFERELGLAASPPPAPTPLLEPPRPVNPPLSPRVDPSQDAHTAQRLEDQRVAYLLAGDPGPEVGQREAWAKHVDAEDRRNTRAGNRALKETLGEGLHGELGKAWAKKINARQALLDGDLTVDDFEELAYEEWAKREARAAGREERASELRTRQINCFVCGRLKKRPADVCDYCGDDPVTYGGDARSFNRNFGFAS